MFKWAFFYNKGGTKSPSVHVTFDLQIVDLALSGQIMIKVRRQTEVLPQILWIHLVPPSGKELTESVCKGGPSVLGTGQTSCQSIASGPITFSHCCGLFCRVATAL